MNQEWDGMAECDECGEVKRMCCGSPKGGACVDCCKPHPVTIRAGSKGYERSDCDQ